MIAYLNGLFSYKTPTLVHVDINGLGYEVQITLNTYEEIKNLDAGYLFTHLIIKEDAHTLFGFVSAEEKEVFLQLISVSGVGANTARMMLSAMKPTEIGLAIASQNVKQLEGVKGIGKKTAERLVLELKDKIGKKVSIKNISMPNYNNQQQDALVALVALGINKAMAEKAIEKTNAQNLGDASLEDFIKSALKNI